MDRLLSPERRDVGRIAGQGLSDDQVAVQRARFGSNRMAESPPAGWGLLLRETVKDPMLWFLLLTSGLFLVVGEASEATILLLALVPFLGMDAFLHRRTQVSTASLGGRLASQARVWRDGRLVTVPAADLVVGDLAEVVQGELFPADGLLESADDLQVDESALTGEAYPVRKKAFEPSLQGVGAMTVPGEHLGLAGTRLLTGKARFRVAFTGNDTLYGDILNTVSRGVQERTPLQQAVAALVMKLVVAAVLMCLILAWVRYRQGFGVLDALLSALTLAVAALPEEFPVVLTFFLGVGVYRLAKRQALVRRAVVVENIGRVTCICSDKTGTLTEGRLELVQLLPMAGFDEASLVAVAALASRPDSGDPMDQAVLAHRLLPASDDLPEVVARFPFTEDRKRESLVYRRSGRVEVVTKGAPEVIFASCDLDMTAAEHWRKQVEILAAQGRKVIACAWQAVADADGSHEPDDGLHFAGLLAFEDPVRTGVPEAVATCQQSGIHIIMVTGDHPRTAAAVATRIGLGKGHPAVIEGDMLAQRIASGNARLAEVDVVARAIPAQKHDLVRALQAEGEVVVVTGDGVNDVPALQAADVGIAMGERGTPSAREVAAIVLMDDNFSTLVRAIAEGRQLFSNLRRSFQYLLMVHMPLVITAALIPMLGFPILYLPIHVVWLEMIIHPTALLVFQSLPESERLTHQTGRQRGPVRFFSRGQALQTLLVGVLVTALVYWSYHYSLGAFRAVEHARAMALATLIMSSSAITLVLSGLHGWPARLVPLGAMLSALIFIQIPVIAGALHLQPLHLDDWALAIGFALMAVLPLVPAWWMTRRRRPTPMHA